LLGFVANFVEGLGVMACSLNPNVSSNTNNPFPTCVGYDSKPMLTIYNLHMKVGVWEIKILLLLMS
jgi:hypothetical protein